MTQTSNRSLNIVHQGLERGRRVRQSEWHYIVIIVTRSKRRFVMVLRFYRNLIISAGEIEF
jgi:hypothetical protein